MIDLVPPAGSPTGVPPNKNPRSPRPDDGTFPVESTPAVGRPEDGIFCAQSMPTGDHPVIATSSAAPVEPGTDAAGRQTAGELAAHFERFFDSFRRQLLECYGKHSDEMIARAEKEVAGRSPGFSLRAIGPDNALLLLDLAETITGQASVFKRGRLRRAALGAVSELYNTHYEALERFGAVDKVE